MTEPEDSPLDDDVDAAEVVDERDELEEEDPGLPLATRTPRST